MTRRSEPSKTSSPYKPSLWPTTLSVHFWQLHTLSCWRRRMSKPQKCNTLTAKRIFCHSSQPPSSPLHHCHLPISPLRLQHTVFSPPEPSCFLSCFSLWALVSELGKGLPCKDSSKMFSYVGSSVPQKSIDTWHQGLQRAVWLSVPSSLWMEVFLLLVSAHLCPEPPHLWDQSLAKWVGTMVLLETALWNSRLISPAGTAAAWLWLQPLEHCQTS